MIFLDGRAERCQICGNEFVFFETESGERIEFLGNGKMPGTDSGMVKRRNRTGAIDGWLSLHPHVCSRVSHMENIE
jgi:hypothetical protein